MVLLAAWEAYLNPRYVMTPRSMTPAQVISHGLSNTLERYHTLGVPVLIVEDNPIQRSGIPIARIRFASNPADSTLNASAISRHAYGTQQRSIDAIIRSAVSPYPDDAAFRSGLALCTANTCPWVRDHQFLYYDSGHLSQAGALDVYPLLALHLDSLFGGRAGGATALPNARDNDDQHDSG